MYKDFDYKTGIVDREKDIFTWDLFTLGNEDEEWLDRYMEMTFNEVLKIITEGNPIKDYEVAVDDYFSAWFYIDNEKTDEHYRLQIFQ